jgi:hypothetical protein
MARGGRTDESDADPAGAAGCVDMRASGGVGELVPSGRPQRSHANAPLTFFVPQYWQVITGTKSFAPGRPHA